MLTSRSECGAPHPLSSNVPTHTPQQTRGRFESFTPKLGEASQGISCKIGSMRPSELRLDSTGDSSVVGAGTS